MERMRVFILYSFFYSFFFSPSLFMVARVFFLCGRDEVRVFCCYPSFLLFYTLAPCPFSSVFLFFIFLFVFVLCVFYLKNNINVNLIRKIIKNYEIDALMGEMRQNMFLNFDFSKRCWKLQNTNASKIYFLILYFFEKTSIRENSKKSEMGVRMIEMHRQHVFWIFCFLFSFWKIY
jgi:hypothetical protein